MYPVKPIGPKQAVGHPSATESRFLDIFGIIMNGALVPVIVCPIESGGYLSTNTPFPGHLPCNYYRPRGARFVAHGARSHAAPRIPSNPAHCTHNRYDGNQPSREPFASEVRNAGNQRTSRVEVRGRLGRVGVRGRARVHERSKKKQRDCLRPVTSESVGGATRGRRNVGTQDIGSQGASRTSYFMLASAYVCVVP